MEYIIDFKQNTPTSDIDSYLNANKLTVINIYDNFELVYVVEGDTIPTKTDIVETIIKNSEHSFNLLDYDLEVSKPLNEDITFNVADDINWWKTYSFKSINFEQEQITYKRSGKNVKIYLLDSGIKEDHPDFENADIVKFFSFVDNFTDTRGHGTALASLLVGKTCGLTDSTLCVVKIFDDAVPTKLSDLLNALNKIFGDFLSNPIVGAVVNISWSIPKNVYVEEKLQMLIDAGMIVVTAAGNNGLAIENVTPACMPSVLTLGSYDQNFTPCDFSNYTQSEISLTNQSTNYGDIDGWAPGIDIYAATLNGSYGMIAGTSASAAIASGGLAYNLSKFLSINHDSLVPLSKFQTTVSTKILKQFTFSRQGLLVLDGNYIASTNLVVTYNQESDFEYMSPSPEKIVHIKNNQENFLFLFPADTVTNITLSEPLPDGMIIFNGWLQGIPLNISFNEAHYFYKNISMTVTTINEKRTFELKLFITDGVDNLTDLNIQDENLAITLQGSQCTNACADDCAGSQICIYCPYGIKSGYCFCDLLTPAPCNPQ